MRTVVLLTSLVLTVSMSMGQILGESNVTVGQSASYTYYGSAVYASYLWYTNPSSLGTVTYSYRSGTTYYADVTWTSAGTGTLVMSAYGSPVVTLNVTVTCPSATTPNATFSYSSNTCGNKTITYTGTPPAGVTWYWQTSSTGTDTSNPTTSLIASASGQYYLRAKPNCSTTWSSAQTTTSVTVNPVPGTASPTMSSNSFCGSGTVYLYGAGAGTNETYRWYDVSTGGTPIASNQPVNATKTFYVALYNIVTTCEGTRTAGTVTINSIPGSAGGSVSPSALCGSGTVAWSGTGAVGGESYRWYSVSSGGSAITPATSISTSTTYYVALYNNTTGCESSTRTAVTATINPIPSAPTASNTTICGTGTMTATAGANGTTVRWYNASTGGTLLATSTSSPSTSTTTTYYVTTYNATTGCESTPRQSVTLTINPIPSAPTASNTSICGTGTMTATVGANGTTVRWYSASTGGTLLATNTTSPSTSTSTTYYITTYNATTGCESTPRQSVTLTVNPIPSAPTAGNTSRCGTGTMTATAGANGTTVRWYSALTGGTLLATSTTSPSTSATTTYFVTTFNATTGCESTPRQSVTLTINPVPSAPTASSTAICGTGTMSATAGANGTTVRWYSALTGGTLLATNTTSPSTTTTTTYYIATYNTTTTCESTPRQAVTLTVNAIPSAPTATNGSRCGTGSVTLIANFGTNGNTVRWYAASTGGTPLAAATSYATPSLSATTTYYVSSYNSTTLCESTAARVAVTATINAIPVAPGYSGNARFGTGPLTLVGSGGTNYKWYTFTNTLLGTGTSYPVASVGASATNYMKVSSLSSAGCEGPTTTIDINVYAQPVVSAPQNFVTKEIPVTLTATAGNETYTWRNSANSIVQTGASNTYDATFPDTYTVTAFKTGATSSAIPYTLNGPLTGLNMNYIVSNTAVLDNITDPVQLPNLSSDKVTQAITYFDGLGRPIQNVATQSSPLKKDIVTPVKYDAYGRQNKEYLPFVSAENTGKYKSSDLTTQANFYSTATAYNNKVKTDGAPWARTVFESSPLNRVLQKGAPGTVWQPDTVNVTNSKAIKMEYLVNVDGINPGQERVKIWTLTAVTLNSKTEYILSSSGNYSSNMLYVNVTKDEENRQVREYTDKLGKVILKKVQDIATTPSINNDSHWTHTYYLYDEFDRLRFVLQPKFIFRNTTYDGLATNQLKKDMLDSLTFEYRYDDRGRMIYKRVPGAKQVDMVYDQWDRLVLSQDGNQRVNGKWSFTKYDVLNRPIITGEIASANTRDAMATAVNAITARNENTASGNGVGYTLNLTYPPTATINDIYTITYYDDYSYKTNLVLGTAYDAVIPGGFTGVVSTRVKNLVTGSKIKVLQSSPAQWLITASYYDDRYRLIHSVGDDHLGNKNKITNEYYGITPWIIKSQLNHGTTLTSLTETTYDHMGRVKEIYQTLDNLPATRTLIASNKYNELGELVEKNVHSTDNGATFLQSNDYRYNIRGWLTHINNSALSNDGTVNDDANDLFGMELKYNEIISINGVNTKDQFNGNISAIQWKTNNLVDASTEKIYGFKYDALNRLTDATYATKNGSLWNANVNLFNENLAYDKNGNINTLKRNSRYNSGTTATLVDDLKYYHKGNQLDAVADNAAAGNKTYGFSESSPLTTGEYEYDANGSMDVDQNKGIVGPSGGDPKGVLYNHLNLPREVRLGSKKIVYTYDAAGTKLRKVAYDNSGTLISRTEYVGGIQYESVQALANPLLATDLKFMMTLEGRSIKEGSNWRFEYFHKDHLGNARVVYGNQKQVDEYLATMETQKATKEQAQFYNITTTRVSANNHTPISIDLTAPVSSAETNGYKTGKAIGPAKMLQVSAGDRVQLEVYARYTTGTGSNNTLITNLASAVTTTFQVVSGEAAFTALTNNVPVQAATITKLSTVPKAYLFYILFNSSYVYQQFGFAQISSAASTAHQQLYLDITIPTGGFLYTYVADESKVNNSSSVYFDDFNIIHTRNNNTLQVVQTTDYYPFGLAMAAQSYQKQSTQDNDYLYNGKELQDEHNLGWMDYGARMYMAEIGRWGVIDPMSDMYHNLGPHSYAANNPILNIDVEGKWTLAIHFALTNNAFQANGYSKKFSDKLSHFSSVYADNPAGVSHSFPSAKENLTWLMSFNYSQIRQLGFGNDEVLLLHYQKGIDYSATANSQSETDPNSQLIHATRTADQAKNGRSRMEAVEQAQTLAWNRIFSIGEKGLGENIDEGDFAALGLATHALQDGERHKGAIYSSNSSVNQHSILGDVFGDQSSSRRVTNSAAKVYNILNGNFNSIGNRSSLYVPGMSMQQILKVIVGLKNNGYNISYSNQTISLWRKKTNQ